MAIEETEETIPLKVALLLRGVVFEGERTWLDTSGRPMVTVIFRYRSIRGGGAKPTYAEALRDVVKVVDEIDEELDDVEP